MVAQPIFSVCSHSEANLKDTHFSTEKSFSHDKMERQNNVGERQLSWELEVVSHYLR